VTNCRGPEHISFSSSARRADPLPQTGSGPGGCDLQTRNNFIIVEVMRKREYLGQLELMVLLAVMRPARDAYGVLISRDIAEKSGREVALASVYAALERLERKGLISSSLGQPTAERGGKARTYFKPTTAGIQEAREAHGTLLRLTSGLPLAER
jgi:PadR family transcriptional regulator